MCVHIVLAMQLFDYISSINSHKQPDDLDGYNQFLVTRHFSYFADSLIQAQEINACRNLTDEEHFAYFYCSLRQRRRVSKWFKNEDATLITDVMNIFCVSENKARETIRVLGRDKINSIIARRIGGPTS